MGQKEIVWFNTGISKKDRQERYKCKAVLLWFTGLPGSGKSTIAKALNIHLFSKGYPVYVLDGDNVRHGLNADLGFSHEDRKENIRRIGEVSKLFVDAGFIVMTAFISPYRDDRQKVRALFPKDEFIEVYIKAGVETCEKRDPKGLYQKARQGLIKEFTGISAPYEMPEAPEITVNTEQKSVEECTEQILKYLTDNHILGTCT